eukprot:2589997-Alexandrium_andersonii.AAC.1
MSSEDLEHEADAWRSSSGRQAKWSRNDASELARAWLGKFSKGAVNMIRRGRFNQSTLLTFKHGGDPTADDLRSNK